MPAAIGLPLALLLHELPDGSRHVDLLLGSSPAPGADERTVTCWRADRRVDRLASGASVDLERIEDHRGLYLRLREPRELDRGRGTVSPLNHGTAFPGEDRTWTVRWADGHVDRWTLVATEGSRWRLTAEASVAGSQEAVVGSAGAGRRAQADRPSDQGLHR
jgi:hypothetical protein